MSGHLGQNPFAAALGVANAGSGGGTLGDAYAAGNVSSDSTITLDSTRSGIVVDGSALSSAAFTVKGAPAWLALQNPTATAVQGTALGRVAYLNGSTEVARIEGQSDGATDSGRLVLNVKKSAGTLGSALQISGAGAISVGVLNGATVVSTLWDNVTFPGLIGNTQCTYALGSSSDIHLISNAYFGSGAWKYQASNAAVDAFSQLGTFTVRVAPSGAANSAITWQTAFQVDSTGLATLARGTELGTSGSKAGITASATFAPTSGTATFAELNLAYTINQTGGANGAVDGLLVTATQTAVGGTHNIFRLAVGANNVFAFQPAQGTTDQKVTWRSEAQNSSYFHTQSFQYQGTEYCQFNVSNAGKVNFNPAVAGAEIMLNANGGTFQIDDPTAGTTPNLGMGGASYGAGKGVFFIGNANTVPTANPTGGGLLYVTGGALKYRGSAGTVTNLANA